MRRSIAAFVVGMLVFPQLVSAQALMPGTRVRFSHPGEGTRTGTVVTLTADTLEVLLPDRAEPARVPLDQVLRLDVSLGKQRQPMHRAGFGFLAGGGLGAVLGFASGSDDCRHEWGCIDRSGGALLGGIAFGFIGGIVGLAAGAIPSEKWERVPLERRRVRVDASPSGHGAKLGLSLAF